MTSKERADLYAHLLSRTTDLRVSIADYTGVREPRERREYDICITLDRGAEHRVLFAPTWSEAQRVLEALRTAMALAGLTHDYAAEVREEATA